MLNFMTFLKSIKLLPFFYHKDFFVLDYLYFTKRALLYSERQIFLLVQSITLLIEVNLIPHVVSLILNDVQFNSLHLRLGISQMVTKIIWEEFSKQQQLDLSPNCSLVLKSSHNNLGNKCQQKMLVRNFFRSGEKLLRSFNFWAKGNWKSLCRWNEYQLLNVFLTT